MREDRRDERKGTRANRRNIYFYFLSHTCNGLTHTNDIFLLKSEFTVSPTYLPYFCGFV